METPSKIRILLLGLALTALTIVVYSPIIANKFVSYDDPLYITENSQLKKGLTPGTVRWAFTTFDAGIYHPLTWISLLVDHALYSMNPAGYHLSALLLHAANTFLLFLVLFRMTGSVWRAAIVAVLFAVHPAHVESVAWAAQRKDVLSTFFWLITMLAYYDYVKDPSVRRYILTLVAFILGLLAKPMLVTLPFVLILLDYWPLNRIKATTSIRRLIWEKVPFLVLAIAISIITVIAVKDLDALAPVSHTSMLTRAANIPVSYMQYLIKLFIPLHLSPFYPHPAVPPAGEIILAVIILAVISLLAVKTAVSLPWLTVGWLWFLGTLVPVIGIMQVGKHTIADRYTYISFIGLFIIIVWSVPHLFRTIRNNKRIIVTAASCVIVLLSWLSFLQVRCWKDNITLYQHMLAVTGDNHVAHNLLALVLHEKGDLKGAHNHLQEALRIDPDNYSANVNMGVVLYALGDQTSALHHFNRAIKIDSGKTEPLLNIAGIYQNQGETDRAVTYLRKAIAVDSTNTSAYMRAAMLLEGQDSSDRAARLYETLLRHKPDYAEAHYKLGVILFRRGSMDTSLIHLAEAVILKPDYADAHYTLGIVLQQRGLPQKAEYHYQQAVKHDPAYTDAYYNLGLLLLNQKRFKEAEEYLRHALLHNPEFGSAHNALGLALVMQGKTQPAIERFEEALRIDPADSSAHANLTAAELVAKQVPKENKVLGH